MTKEDMAAKLRELARDRTDYDIGPSLEALADELDPPTPAPGTVVWWRFNDGDPWQIGIVYGRIGSDNAYGILDYNETRRRFDKIQWKPARILRPRQVAVDVPPARTWGKEITDLEIVLIYWDTQEEDYRERVKLIDREEAERMEAEDDSTT